jgi:hypothetical protein
MVIDDLKIVICSYLTLEENLELFEEPGKIRNQLLKLYPEVESIYVEIDRGNYYTVKYLIDEKDVNCNFIGADLSCEKGDIKILQYLISKNIKSTSIGLQRACENKDMNIVKYLLQNNIKPTEDYIDVIIRNKNLEVLKLFIEYSVIIGTDHLWHAKEVGDQSTIMYLQKRGYDI